MALRVGMKSIPEIRTILIFCITHGIIQNSTFCKDLHCYVDFIDTLTCTYEAEDGSTDGTLYELSATWIDDDNLPHCLLNQSSIDDHVHQCILHQSAQRCPLSTYTCSLNMEKFSAADTICVNVTKTISGRYEELKERKEFTLSDIFMPSPPFNLSVSFSAGYNFTWNMKYESTVYFLLRDELEYELSYKKKEEPWENQKSTFIQMDRKNVLLVQAALQADTEYVSRVRAKPGVSSYYKGPWSEWSPLLTWRTEQDDTSRGKIWSNSHWLPSVGVGLVILTVLLFAYCRVPWRLWKRMSVLVPNPAPFFKPLYMGHDGDFKSWLGTSYTVTALDLFDWGVSLPDVVEVYSQQLSKHASRVDLTEMEQDHTQNSCNVGLGIHSQEQSRFLIPCRSVISNLGQQSYGHLSSDAATVFEGATPCPQFTSFNSEINHGVEEDGYPVMDLDDSMSSLLMADSHTQEELLPPGPVITDNVIKHGRPPTCESMEDPLMSLLGPNMSVLDLLHRQPDAWEETPGPTSSPSQDEDSVSYSEDAYNSFSSNSGNGEDFGYPRIGLDLDTIDSGFADSECGSPLECDFNKNDMAGESSSFSSGSIALNADEQHPRNYVKQWISDNSTISNDG